jgi:hypothetical protein
MDGARDGLRHGKLLRAKPVRSELAGQGALGTEYSREIDRHLLLAGRVGRSVRDAFGETYFFFDALAGFGGAAGASAST